MTIVNQLLLFTKKKFDRRKKIQTSLTEKKNTPNEFNQGVFLTKQINQNCSDFCV